MTGKTLQTTPLIREEDLFKIKDHLVDHLAREVEANPLNEENKRQVVNETLAKTYAQSNLKLPDTARDQLFHSVIDELLGYGPIQPLLDDPDITEVMVNRFDQIYIERNGKIIKTNIAFASDDHVRRVIDRIVLPLGRTIDADNPTVDARLPDGSRVNAVIPPVAIDGPSITIRKFNTDKLSIEQLITLGSVTPEMVTFLQACVVARLNVLISGGTGSGKTTLLNILSGCIPESERIVTIEDAAELQLQQEHVVRLETKPPKVDGTGRVTIRDLVRNSLRMRPDRIVVGEVRGGEALDML